MSQHVPDFKNPLALMAQEKFAENRVSMPRSFFQVSL